MHPEKPLVPSFTMSLANRPARVFVKELADHGLSDSMDDSRVGSPSVAVTVCERRSLGRSWPFLRWLVIWESV